MFNTVMFSVLISCYNSSKTIRRCLDSVLNQKYQNFEIFIVDDCSTDNTVEILNQYYKKTDKIKQIKIHETNQSAVGARVDLMKMAKWDYSIFVDSDDCITEDCLLIYNDLIQKNNLDIIVTDFQSINLNNQLPQPKSSDDKQVIIYGKDNVFNYSFSLNNYFQLWNKVIKTSILNQIEVPKKHVSFVDDHMFMLQIYRNCQSFGIFKTEPTYIYYFGQGQWNTKMDQNKYNRICNGFKDTLIYQFQYAVEHNLKSYLNAIFQRFGFSYLVYIAKGNERLLKIYNNCFGKQFFDTLNEIANR